MKTFVAIFIAVVLAIGVSDWVSGQFGDWSKRVEEQKTKMRAAQAAVDEPHDFPAALASDLDSAEIEARVLKRVLWQKPFSRPLSPYEGDLMDEADSTIKVVGDERARMQKEERRADAEDAAEASAETSDSAASPTPKGSWMWGDRGDPLERGAYNQQ